MKKTRNFYWMFFLLCLMGGLFLYSCTNEDIIDENPSTTSLVGTIVSVDNFSSSSDDLLRCSNETNTHSFCGNSTNVILYAGQNIEVGSLTISNDDENLYVEYRTNGGWVLCSTHLYVGPLPITADKQVFGNENGKFRHNGKSRHNRNSSKFIGEEPFNKSGNPKIGNFPYSTKHFPCVTSFMYTIPLEDLDSTFIVAAHADVLLLGEGCRVRQQETAWANGDRFVEQGNWAMYVNYIRQLCEPCIIVPSVFPLTATLGSTLGNVTVTNDNINLYVTYNATGSYTINATSLYVGTLADIPLGLNGVPDHTLFPEIDTFSTPILTFTYTIPLSSLPPDYIIAAYVHVWCVDGWGNGGVENSFNTIYGVDISGWILQYYTQVCQ